MAYYIISYYKLTELPTKEEKIKHLKNRDKLFLKTPIGICESNFYYYHTIYLLYRLEVNVRGIISTATVSRLPRTACGDAKILVKILDSFLVYLEIGLYMTCLLEFHR